MRINFSEAQRNVSEMANRESYSRDFLFELMAAYGRSTAAITKLRSGSLNLAADTENEVLQRGVVYFKHTQSEQLHSSIDALDKDPWVVRYNPRYLIVTDYNQLVAKDTKKDTTLDIKLRDIDRNVDFFFGWTGNEVTSEKTEAVADRRAADKMKDLYVEIEKINRDKLADKGSNFRHHLNVFFSRLLFCFFAEDTKVFSKEDGNIFTSSIKDYTQTDGSDLDEFLSTLFDALDTADKNGFTSPYSKFPYVNGTIFDSKKHNIAVPKFNAQARKLILDCGNQNWAEINPDIFGSMFQSIVDDEHRANNGTHYTSVPNIMKTIEPLFLDELREEFDANYDNPKQLEKLWDRISNIKIFDPACGSGNFLIIAYKELRKIEHGIIDRLYSDDYTKAQLAGKLESHVKLDNFYGIEIDDFAHEIAILSLYLAKHQMNIEFEEHFGKEIILTPLMDNAKIVHGNAARLDWQGVCPNVQHSLGASMASQQHLLEIEQEKGQSELISDDELNQKTWDEIYLIGNPPYLGTRNQDLGHKLDKQVSLHTVNKYKILDYIAIWFYKGSKYIAENPKSMLAFVTTNSITQGDQLSTFWPHVLVNTEINFAYTSFKWTNNAKNAAGVTVAIISLRNKSKKPKFLFSEGIKKQVDFISANLTDHRDVFVGRRAKPISNLPKMSYGNHTGGSDSLFLTKEDKIQLLHDYPDSSKFIRRLVGSIEMNRGLERYCLWIESKDLKSALSIPPIKQKVENRKRELLDKGDAASVKLASKAYQFRDTNTAKENQIVVPIVFSSRRKYVVCDYLDKNVIIPNSAQALYDVEPWVFSLISSLMHMSWVRAVAGRLKTDYRYSSAIVYNNFPIRALIESEKNELNAKARNILFMRQNYTEKTLAEMYDPTKMPEDLRQAHHELDLTVDRLYRLKPYSNDEERLADLFSLYEQMIDNNDGPK